MTIGNIPGWGYEGKGRKARKVDNLIVIYETVVYKI
jgi:hypothetical protein